MISIIVGCHVALCAFDVLFAMRVFAGRLEGLLELLLQYVFHGGEVNFFDGISPVLDQYRHIRFSLPFNLACCVLISFVFGNTLSDVDIDEVFVVVEQRHARPSRTSQMQFAGRSLSRSGSVPVTAGPPTTDPDSISQDDFSTTETSHPSSPHVPSTLQRPHPESDKCISPKPPSSAPATSDCKKSRRYPEACSA